MAHWLYWVLTTVAVAGAGCAYEAHEEGAGTGASSWVMADGGAAESTPEVSPTEGELDEPSDHGPEEQTLAIVGERWHAEPAVVSTVEAWRWRHESYGDVASPDITRCDARLENLEVIVPSHDEFRRLCHRCDLTDPSPQCASMGRINACAGWGDTRDDDGIIGAPHALVVLDASQAAVRTVREQLIVHETIHHLGTCTRGGPDAPHANEAWWCAGADCIQGRGYAALGLER